MCVANPLQVHSKRSFNKDRGYREHHVRTVQLHVLKEVYLAVITRRQVFFEDHSQLVNLEHNGVQFKNVPSCPDRNGGGFAMSGRVWSLLDEISGLIPSQLQPAVTVDMAKIDVWEWLERAYEREHGHRLPEEHVISEPEAQLLQKIFGEQWQPEVRVVTDEEWERYCRGEWPPEEEIKGEGKR